MAETPASGAYRRQEIILLVLGFVALVAVGLASAWLVSRNAEFSRQVTRTLETKAEIVRALSLAQDAETGQRGYLLTGDERYLGPYKSALANAEDRLRRLRELIDPTGPQNPPFEDLLTQMKIKFEELGETVELQLLGKTAEARAVVDAERGQTAMQAIRRIVTAMTDHEDRQFAERSASAARSSTLLLVVMVIGLVIAGVLAFLGQRVVMWQARSLENAHAALGAANTGLEAAVAERTAELVSANEEIQRFAYIVSHDLRAPLVNIMGFTSELDAARRTLKDQIDSLEGPAAELVRPETRIAIEEDLPEAIGFIRSSTTKMDRLINAILRLSREGRRAIRPESVQVEEVVRGIADTIHQQTQAADAEIEVARGLPPLVTDRLTLEQIFQNLIENAVKYLDRTRPGRIVVGGRRIGPQVEYAIEDNGRGIDANDHERVFELFRRAGAQDQPGEGLGLAFVRANVRRLGGTIRLTSEPGRGSTFHLTFPAVFRPPSESRPA